MSSRHSSVSSALRTARYLVAFTRAFGLGSTLREAVPGLVRNQVGGLPMKAFRDFQAELQGRLGLEIGGPTPMFREGGRFPVYPLLVSIDNVNFAPTTLWQADGLPRMYRRTFVCESTDLRSVPENEYDVVLASHTIEHTSDPIRALKEWTRVLRSNGLLVMVVPDKRRTFDHRRPVTPLSHLIDDFEAHRAEDDMSHMAEALRLSDLSLDPDAGSGAQFRQRTFDNLRWRALHHHVFIPENLRSLMEYSGLSILRLEEEKPGQLVSIARPAGGEPERSFRSTAIP